MGFDRQLFEHARVWMFSARARRLRVSAGEVGRYGCELCGRQLGLAADPGVLYELRPETAAIEGSSDSLDLVEYIMSVEDDLGFRFTDDDCDDDLASVRRFVCPPCVHDLRDVFRWTVVDERAPGP